MYLIRNKEYNNDSCQITKRNFPHGYTLKYFIYSALMSHVANYLTFNLWFHHLRVTEEIVAVNTYTHTNM